MPLTVDDQQAVIDAVQHCLKSLLAGNQLRHISGLVLAQGLRHAAEALGQLIHLQRRGNRQGDVIVTLANVLGCLG
ncbi:hypothetical protein D3C72_2182010 [compost metagenome]